jgi:hypothetical protein
MYKNQAQWKPPAAIEEGDTSNFDQSFTSEVSIEHAAHHCGLLARQGMEEKMEVTCISIMM